MDMIKMDKKLNFEVKYALFIFDKLGDDGY